MSSRQSIAETEGIRTRNQSRVPSIDSQNENRHHRRPRPKKQTPQRTISDFWNLFTTKTPGKAFTILPDNLYAERLAAKRNDESSTGKHGPRSYKEAARICKGKVEKIVKECKRINRKYVDNHFDLEKDFQNSQYNGVPECLVGLDDHYPCHLRPKSVKRIEDIFSNPRFFIKGATANDVRQGNEGDCWFMSALCTLSNMPGLIDKVCVARDEKVGVYGFVFFRDGDWVSTIIDDKLYITASDFHDMTVERESWLNIQHRKDPEAEYRRVMQTGSRALYFAQCADSNETWLPLLEKAYAKAHGDYFSIEGGYVGEGIEDLTGGVTTELFATDILDREKFWKEELLQVNKQFLFGAAQSGGKTGKRQGIIERHAYSIMDAVEVDGKRLCKLRNPWGHSEFDGPYSDGSKEWTPDLMRKLKHQFGDDGVFWLSYDDLLRHYQHFDRTRLFGPEWQVTQQWTSLNVPWWISYHDTKFCLTMEKTGPVVIVLGQLDDRYWRGLEGRYRFKLQFRLHKDNESDYIVRSHTSYYMRRSVSTEVELERGQYSVLIKVSATRDPSLKPVEDVLRNTCNTRRDKLLAMGLSYDLAHAKGHFKESEEEKHQRQVKDRRDRRRAMARAAYEARKKNRLKDKLRRQRRETKRAEKMAKALAAAQTASTENGHWTDEPPLSDDEGSNGIDGLHRQMADGFGEAVRATETQAARFAKAHKRTDSTGSLSLPTRTKNGRSRSDSQTPRIEVNGSPMPRRKVSVSEMSDDEMSWDSELDVPSDTDEELGYDNYDAEQQSRDASEDEFERDPWNAVCVIGLRVYSKDSAVEISIVRPNHDDRTSRRERKLDVDDSAADATKHLNGTRSEAGSEDGTFSDVYIGAEPESVEENRQG